MICWPTQLGWFALFASYCGACILQKVGTEHPWLIRIELLNPFKGTITHGSLISANRVLTAASIKLELVKASVNVKEPLKSDALAMTAYNSVLGCNQTQFAREIDFHWKYEDKYNYLHLGEFALLTARENFATAGGPFIISTPYTGMVEKVETILHELRKGRMDTTAISTYMLVDKNAGGATIAGDKLSFVPWQKCVEFDSFKKIKGASDPALTNCSFFCSQKIPGKSGAESNSDGFGYDWYQGAPVVVRETASSNMTTGNEFAIGQYLFWTGETGSPFVFAAFTQYLIDFIEDKIPYPTKVKSTEKAATFPASFLSRSIGPTTRRAKSDRVAQTSGGNVGPATLLNSWSSLFLPLAFPLLLLPSPLTIRCKLR